MTVLRAAAKLTIGVAGPLIGLAGSPVMAGASPPAPDSVAVARASRSIPVAQDLQKRIGRRPTISELGAELTKADRSKAIADGTAAAAGGLPIPADAMQFVSDAPRPGDTGKSVSFQSSTQCGFVTCNHIEGSSTTVTAWWSDTWDVGYQCQNTVYMYRNHTFYDSKTAYIPCRTDVVYWYGGRFGRQTFADGTSLCTQWAESIDGREMCGTIKK